MDIMREIAEKNQKKAYDIINKTSVVNIWKSFGAEINLIGSLKTGLLMIHKDIDFHIYSSPLTISTSFSAMAQIAENPAIVKVEYSNLIDTMEQCIEWHAWYKDEDEELWQIDMIHMPKGSKYDGYFEKVADRINAVVTEQQRVTILKLKYETPSLAKIPGVEYYMAVISDGILNYQEFTEWRKTFSPEKGMNWMP